ncbi:protein-disulfide reductase [Burkholderia ubonensis]|nr:protein-disulfide reductase DsbD [Burkholderia ubonensis]KVZ34835.1 protein-disulfide reductase [Burkholderia ubonensis]KWB22458.1 protein-disulfide reductase [Burkholderia ubonensis]KWC29516.1 protein-disulfide reductase [Burkholderia ubonensis]
MRTTSSNAYQSDHQMADTLSRLFRFALVLLLGSATLSAYAVSESELLAPEQAFPLTVSLACPTEVVLDFKTQPGYYLYRDRFSFAVDGTSARPDAMPPSETKNDPTFGVVQVYHQPVRIRLPLSAAVTSSAVLTVTSQGCADVGVCYPPQTRGFRIAADGEVTPAALVGSAKVTDFPVAEKGRQAAVSGLPLRPANGIGVAELLGFLIAGLLMAGTVCMYPLIPIVTAVIDGTRERLPVWRGFSLSFAYVQGLAITYAAAGTVAAVVGIPLVALTQKPWLLATFGALMLMFALGTFGVFRLQLPTGWQTRFAGWSKRLPGGRVGPVFVMGMLSALIVGPCSTPALAGALLYIANSHDISGGALALYLMGIGIGIPLLLVGTFGTRLLPKSGRWMVAVQDTLGVMLLAAALWFVYSLLPAWLLMLLVALLLIACGMMLRAIDPLPPDATGLARVGKALGVLLLIAGIAEFVGVASGNFDMLTPLGGLTRTSASAGDGASSAARFDTITSNAKLDEALKAARGQPVMVDFYADWCITCKELERFTFADARVTNELTHWKLLRIDVTNNTEADTAMLRRFGLFGPPALIFFDKTGRQQPDAQLIGFIGADTFLAHLKRLQSGDVAQ